MTRVPKLWDIFCKVIDNYGDVGVCWRLCCDLASRGERVRLWIDDATALQWMAPGGCAGVEIRAWTQPLNLKDTAAGDVLIEAFGCNVDIKYIANYSIRTWKKGKNYAWINLEYLSAEEFAARSHGLPSPVCTGPAAGMTKHFFYPGFTAGAGGLLQETDLLERHARFDKSEKFGPSAWLQQFGITLDTARGERLISLFCYEPQALDRLLIQLATGATSGSAPETVPTRLLVTHGRGGAAVRASLARIESKKHIFPKWNIDSLLSHLIISYLPALTQLQFDELLWACDLNFVRGEDSLVRAIWAGKPFVWQIYPQHDDAHHAKLTAFLDMMDAPLSLRRFSMQWNSIAVSEHSDPLAAKPRKPDAPESASPKGDWSAAPQALELEILDLPAWGASAATLRSRLLAQTDLTAQLIDFADGKRRSG